MAFAQRRNRLTTHFSERIPVVKRRICVLMYLKKPKLVPLQLQIVRATFTVAKGFVCGTRVVETPRRTVWATIMHYSKPVLRNNPLYNSWCIPDY